jgi:prepilin-type N-terminal cleavage/methylation domain-containing protein
LPIAGCTPAGGARRSARAASVTERGFTMIEIALCLAIIGFALLSILIVLPGGMNTQRDTRQETLIGQDASELLEAISTGARGNDDLTNYVYAVTNYYTVFNSAGKIIHTGFQGYTYNTAVKFLNGSYTPLPAMHLTNGLRIIGVFSTPEFTAGDESADVYGAALSTPFGQGIFSSNHVVAYVHSFSGLAAEKPPQNNELMTGDTFSYRLTCLNAPVATDTNVMFNAGYAAYTKQLAANLRDLRLLFSWPLMPNGHLPKNDQGGFRQNFRTLIAGQLIVTNYGNYFPYINNLYFYESQSFVTNAP